MTPNQIKARRKAVDEAIARSGGPTELARRLSERLDTTVKVSVCTQWKSRGKIGASMVRHVAAISGVSVHRLDITTFGPEPLTNGGVTEFGPRISMPKGNPDATA